MAQSSLRGGQALDIVAHALWTTAAAVVGRRKTKQPIHLGWAATWGVLPDVVAFAAPAAVRIGRVLSGSSRSLMPDGSGPRFDWVWGLYNGTHSLLIFLTCFAAASLWFRRPVLEMLGWALHIVIDIFTHRGLFAIRFLWPVSSVHVEGTRWEMPWMLAANYAALAAIWLFLWLRRSSIPQKASS